MPYAGHSRSELFPYIPVRCKTLLDIGCNLGHFGAALKKDFSDKGRSLEIWGVEPQPAAVNEAARVLDRVVLGYYDESIDLPIQYFDAIVFADSLEHFPDPGVALSLCKKQLVPGGIVVCSLPNMRFIDNLEHLILAKDWRYEDAGIRDKTHLRFFTKLSAQRTFEEAGYRVHSIEGINEDWWKKGKPLRRLLFRLFPELTSDMRFQQFVVVASPA